MIEAKNIKLENDILSFEYKSGLDKDYESLSFNIKTDEIVSSSIEMTSNREGLLRTKLIKKLLNQIENNNLKEEYTNIWY